MTFFLNFHLGLSRSLRPKEEAKWRRPILRLKKKISIKNNLAFQLCFPCYGIFPTRNGLKLTFVFFQLQLHIWVLYSTSQGLIRHPPDNAKPSKFLTPEKLSIWSFFWGIVCFSTSNGAFRIWIFKNVCFGFLHPVHKKRRFSTILPSNTLIEIH